MADKFLTHDKIEKLRKLGYLGTLKPALPGDASLDDNGTPLDNAPVVPDIDADNKNETSAEQAGDAKALQDLHTEEAPNQILSGSPLQGLFDHSPQQSPQQYDYSPLLMAARMYNPDEPANYPNGANGFGDPSTFAKDAPQTTSNGKSGNIRTVASSKDDNSDESDTPSKPALTDIDAGTGSINTMQNMADAMKTANNVTLMNELGKSGDKILAGLTRTNPQFLDQYNEGIQRAQQIPAQFQALAGQEENDPNSPKSQAFKQYLKTFGINLKGDVSAATAQSLLPAIYKQFEGEQNRQLKSAMNAQTVAERERAAAENNQTRQLVAAIAANAKRDVAGTNADAKIKTAGTGREDKALQNTQQLLESARGNPAAAQAERDLYSASKADSLMNLYGDPNKLSLPQVNLLAQEIAKIASGGVPSMHELDGINKTSLTGKLSGVVSTLVNHPTPANAAAFVKQYADYTHALKKDAQKVINDKYGRVIESRKKQLGDDNYKSLQNQYMHRFDNSDTNQASASNKPQTVVQNGHTYTLNPQTGEYE